MKLLRKVILWAFATWALSLLTFWVTTALYSYDQELKFRKQLLSTHTSALTRTIESTFKSVVDQSRLSWKASQVKEGRLSSKVEIEENLHDYWSLQTAVARVQIFRRKGSHTDFEWTPAFEWETENPPPTPFDIVPRFGLAFEGYIETVVNHETDSENPPGLYFAISVKREKYHTPKELIGIQINPQWTDTILASTLKESEIVGALVSSEGYIFSSSDTKRYPRGLSVKHLPLVENILLQAERREETAPAKENSPIAGQMNFKPFPKESEVLAQYQELAGTSWFLITHLPQPSWRQHVFLQRRDLPLILYAVLGMVLSLCIFSISTLNVLRRSFKTKHVREKAKVEAIPPVSTRVESPENQDSEEEKRAA